MCQDIDLCLICGSADFDSCLNTYACSPFEKPAGKSLLDQEYKGKKGRAALNRIVMSRRREIDWLYKYHLLGVNSAYTPIGEGDHSVFVIEEARANKSNSIRNLEIGDDPRLPDIPLVETWNQVVEGPILNMVRLVHENSSLVQVEKVNNNNYFPLLLSVHCTCYQDLLCKAIATRNRSKFTSSKHGVHNDSSKGNESEHPINLEALYKALKMQKEGDLHRKKYSDDKNVEEFGLPIENRRICTCRKWPLCFDDLRFTTNPVNIPELQEYYQAIPAKFPADSMVEAKTSYHQTRDIFSSLPVEIILLIIENLEPTSVNALGKTSPAIAAALDATSYWKKTFQNYQPWLFDLPEELFEREKVDWGSVYEDLLYKSEVDDEFMILGLANRRRIWAVCDMIADEYILNLN